MIKMSWNSELPTNRELARFSRAIASGRHTLPGISHALVVAIAAIAMSAPGLARAQEDGDKTSSAKSAVQDPSSADHKAAEEKARLEYEQEMLDWKKAAKEALYAMREFTHCENKDAEAWREKWRIAVEAGTSARDRAAKKALAYYKLAVGKRDALEARGLVVQKVNFDVQNGRYETAFKVYSELVRIHSKDHGFKAQLGRMAMNTNRFDLAEKISLELINDQRLEYRDLFKDLAELKADWEKELEIREQEKDDKLPQVAIKTSKGTIVVELFENQAPETVANFIYLVRNGYYQGKKFHRVIGGFMAQTGAPSGIGSGYDGYSIYDEYGREDARKHFRGVLSMANTGNPNSGGPEFFITFAPNLRLNGGYTAFGRVLSGDEVLERLKITYTIDDNGKDTKNESVIPDEVIKAEVLNDSGKEYKPNKVDGG